MTDCAPTPIPLDVTTRRAHVAVDHFDDLVRQAILRSSARLRRAVSGGEPTARRARSLDRWYGGFAAEVRGHLELTETELLPRLAQRGLLDERELEAVAADHAWVDHLLGELGDALGVLGFGLGDRGPWQRQAGALADELDLVLAGVMSREARTIAPLAAARLSTEELNRIERQRRRDLTVRRAPFALAWLCDTLGDDVESAILAAVPGPARLVFRARRRAYARAVELALGA